MTSPDRGYFKLLDFDRVVQHFGNWPTFHDAEVLSLTLDRSAHAGEPGPTLTLQIHSFATTREITASGHNKTVKHCVVTLAFYGVVLEKLEDFNGQNAIMGMSITDISANQIAQLNLGISIVGAYGLTCEFQCKSGRVLELSVGAPAGSQYAKMESTDK